MTGVQTCALPISGGSSVTLSAELGPMTITQTPQVNAEFSVSYILGGYRVVITNQGLGFAINDTITISGDLIGGTTPENDLVMTVSGVDVQSINPTTGSITSTGQITKVICAGTVPGAEEQYYFKVISATEFEVYSDPLFKVHVSGDDIPFSGIKTTTVTGTHAGSNTITVASTSGFNAGDPVTFTGNVGGGLVVGRNYYIQTLSPLDRKSTRLNSSHMSESRMPSSA